MTDLVPFNKNQKNTGMFGKLFNTETIIKNVVSPVLNKLKLFIQKEDIQEINIKMKPNGEIISGEISYSDVFTPQDIELIRTVDSANFLARNSS